MTVPMKDSGVEWLGEVPAHWNVGATRRFYSFNPSKQEISTRHRSEEVSFLPMEAIGETGTLDLTRTRQIKEVETGYSYFANGDVVVAKITPCFENGKGAAVDDLIGGVGFGTTELIVLRPSRSVTQKFSWWLFAATGFRRFTEGHMEGSAGQKRIQDDWLKAQKVAIPPHPEQETISSHLDRATTRIDALVAKKTRFIELLREKRQALITHAVTKGLDAGMPMKDSGVEWLGEVPAHWDVVRGNAVFVECTKRNDPLVSENYLSLMANIGVIPYEEKGDVGNKKPEDVGKCKLVEPGDFVLNSMNYAIGSYGVSKYSGVCSPVYVVMKHRPEAADPNFLDLILSNPSYQNYAQSFGTGILDHRRAIGWDEIKVIRVPLPPLNEQAAIAAWAISRRARIDNLIATTERSIELLREHRTALITAAVTGKIDLRNAA